MNGRGVAVQEAEAHLQVRAEARQVAITTSKEARTAGSFVTACDKHYARCRHCFSSLRLDGFNEEHRWAMAVSNRDLFGVNEARYHCANRPCSVQLYRTYQGSANPLV